MQGGDCLTSPLRIVAGAQNQPGRRVLVAFTDGHNTRGEHTFEQVLTAARSAGVTIFAVGLGAASRTVHGVRLSILSAETGGISLFPQGVLRADAADAVYRRIVGEVRSQYTLGYVSTDEARDGRWREVKIRLVRPEHRNLRVRTRSGYSAAEPAPKGASGALGGAAAK
jgi:Ca-activated chloride channel family protein